MKPIWYTSDLISPDNFAFVQWIYTLSILVKHFEFPVAHHVLVKTFQIYVNKHQAIKFTMEWVAATCVNNVYWLF